MLKYLDNVGFDLVFEEERQALGERAMKEGQYFPVPLAGGGYILWKLANGVELWFHRLANGKITQVIPFFNGQCVNQVSVRFRIPVKDQPLAGGFYGWLNNDGREQELDDNLTLYGDYPLPAYVPDFRLHDLIEPPALLKFKVVGFADEVEITPGVSEKEDPLNVDEATRDKLLNLSSRDLSEEISNEIIKILSVDFRTALPSFFPANELSELSCFSGKILDVALYYNGVAPHLFHWLKVRSYGADFDLLLADRRYPGAIDVGMIISGSALMVWQPVLE